MLHFVMNVYRSSNHWKYPKTYAKNSSKTLFQSVLIDHKDELGILLQLNILTVRDTAGKWSYLAVGIISGKQVKLMNN